MANAKKPISSLRWWIGGLLFASTIINYIDRQTLSLLAPYLRLEYHWTYSDYANLAIAFRVAYTIGQTVCGKLMDRVGTRRGLTITVIWYSRTRSAFDTGVALIAWLTPRSTVLVSSTTPVPASAGT